MPCLHEKFESKVEVARICPEEGMLPSHYSADIQIRCADCHIPFTFLGADTGVQWDRPTIAGDRQQLRAPIHPANGTIPMPPKIKGFSIKGVRP